MTAIKTAIKSTKSAKAVKAQAAEQPVKVEVKAGMEVLPGGVTPAFPVAKPSRDAIEVILKASNKLIIDVKAAYLVIRNKDTGRIFAEVGSVGNARRFSILFNRVSDTDTFKTAVKEQGIADVGKGGRDIDGFSNPEKGQRYLDLPNSESNLLALSRLAKTAAQLNGIN